MKALRNLSVCLLTAVYLLLFTGCYTQQPGGESTAASGGVSMKISRDSLPNTDLRDPIVLHGDTCYSVRYDLENQQVPKTAYVIQTGMDGTEKRVIQQYDVSQNNQYSGITAVDTNENSLVWAVGVKNDEYRIDGLYYKTGQVLTVASSENPVTKLYCGANSVVWMDKKNGFNMLTYRYKNQEVQQVQLGVYALSPHIAVYGDTACAAAMKDGFLHFITVDMSTGQTAETKLNTQNDVQFDYNQNYTVWVSESDQVNIYYMDNKTKKVSCIPYFTDGIAINLLQDVAVIRTTPEHGGGTYFVSLKSGSGISPLLPDTEISNIKHRYDDSLLMEAINKKGITFYTVTAE